MASLLLVCGNYVMTGASTYLFSEVELSPLRLQTQDRATAMPLRTQRVEQGSNSAREKTAYMQIHPTQREDTIQREQNMIQSSWVLEYTAKATKQYESTRTIIRHVLWPLPPSSVY